MKEIFKATLRLGGSISGEHGIGMSKAAYLPLELGPDAIAVMKKIKQTLDPNNILNPGEDIPGKGAESGDKEDEANLTLKRRIYMITR